MISIVREAETPTGTHKFHLVFLDDDYNPVDESIATQWRVHEINQCGIPVGSFCGFCEKPHGPHIGL
jgi:hypothetical protein